MLGVIFHHQPEMRFRLVYDGPLVSAQTSHKKRANGWAIRANLQPQLAQLWTFKPALLGHAESYGGMRRHPGGYITLDLPEGAEEGETAEEVNRRRLATPVERGDHHYLPIVRSDLFLTCSLDILFLRKDDPGELFDYAGDLDNRIKILFDGLSIPDADDSKPDALTANPFHCLLENDRLITSFAIRTDRLLNRPAEPQNSVVLIIDVVISPTRVQGYVNSGFTWD